MSKKIYPSVVVTLLLLSSTYFAKAATYTASRTGNWTTPSTWGQIINIPTASDIVIIPNGFTVTVSTTTAVGSTLTINSGGKLTISNNDKLTIGGALSNSGNITMGTATSLLVGGALTNSGTISTSTGTLNVTGLLTNSGTVTVGVTNAGSMLLGNSLKNSGTITVVAGATLTFDGAANSTINSNGGTYTITGTVVMDMGSSTTALDVQDPKFISGINSGGKYYFTFTRGIFQMDNTGTLNNASNSGSAAALTIPNGVTLESDNGTMYLANKGTSGNVLLEGKLLMNGGTVYVQNGQTTAQDFQYNVTTGTPQLYVNSGTLNIGAGFNPQGGTDYVDFNMTGGTINLATQQQSTNSTFQLANLAGGKTVMSGGLIVLDQPDNATSSADLDMGGPNVSTYNVTGGTVQLGISTSTGTIFGINPYPTTTYPNIVVGPGSGETVIGYPSGNLNVLSLYINSNASFDATGSSYGTSVPILNITGSDGAYSFDNEGSFVAGTNTVQFSGGVAQVVTSPAASPTSFYNLTVANTGGNVVLGAGTKVTNQLTFSSGDLDASAYPLTLTNGAKTILGATNSSYVITGDGITNTGYLAIQGLTKNAPTTFPIGTSSYYLPVTLNPGNINNTAYSAYVYPGVTTTGKSNGASVSSGLLSEMADITWEIAQTTGSNSTSVALNWAAPGTAMEGSAFKTYGTNIGLTEYSGGAWGLVTGSGNVATETANASFTGLNSTFTPFSVIGTNTAILPLVLGNFNAKPQGSTSLLTWTAYPDGQTGSFTIQRSLDGLTWSDIGVVQADVAATMETDYSFTDVAPAAGQNNYRLFIQNQDGSSMYSSIKVVEFSSTAKLTIYPNPANTTLTISIGSSDKPLNFRLVNTAGMVLQSRLVEAGVATVTMNTGSYPAGVYYLETLDGGQLLQTTAVMVVH